MLAGRARVAGTCCALAISIAGCSSPDLGIDESRARTHLSTLAGPIGRRPVGSAANARAREYVVDQLTRAGFAVRLQDTDVSDTPTGTTTHVVNVLGWRDGAVRDAIALTTHYDSVPDGPGAADDALGVATCLEAGRVLIAGGPMQHSLLVLVTDGEEAGLRGARAAITDPEVRARVRAFLNFDGTGAAGPPFLFEAGLGHGAPLDAWAQAAAAPVGASFGYEIFRRLPNDTDFTVFKTLDASGLNFAPVDDSYGYHTDRDRPERVELATLRRELANTVTTVRALDRAPSTSDAGTPTYFDVLHRRGFAYGPGVTQLIAIIATTAGALFWMGLTAMAWRARGVAGLLVTPVAALLSAGASVGAAIGAAWVMRAMRGEAMPWYTSPGRFCLWLLAAGLTGRWVAGRLVAGLPDRRQPWRSPLAVWWVTLPVWTGLLVFLQLQAPAASFLVAWPLLAAVVLLAWARQSSGAARAASLVVLIVAAVFWLDNVARLIRFVVPLFGWMRALPPVWLLPALLAAGAVMLAPPLIALFARREPARGSIGGPVIVVTVMLAMTGGLSWSAPEYTPDRPERRSVRFVQDDIRHEAWWEVTAAEPRLGLPPPGGPEGVQWTRATGSLQAAMTIGAPAGPFLFRSPAMPRRDVAIGAATATWTRAADGTFDVDLTITSRSLAVIVALPAGVEPRDSTLPGAQRSGRWSATFIAPPPSLRVHMRFDRDPAGVLAQTAVLFTTPDLPDAPGGALPAWLMIPEATWSLRTAVIVPIQR